VGYAPARASPFADLRRRADNPELEREEFALLAEHPSERNRRVARALFADPLGLAWGVFG
jgi:hypothetical protein